MYAGLRRVEGSLRGCTCQKKRLHERLRKFFDRKWSSQLLAAQPTQSCLRLKINKCLRADAALKTHMISLGFERESQIPRDALVE